jgi:hypothetical protein
MGHANLVEWLLAEAAGEPIEAVVIGAMGWADYGSEEVPGYVEKPKGKVLTWEQAKPHLDYDFDDGFGAFGCNALYAWTPSKVMLIVQYDGRTSLRAVPRHPVDVMPEMAGG